MIRLCKECAFILGTRPGLRDVNDVCMPCINNKKKASIDFSARQAWLTQYIQKNITSDEYDCVIAVSGGKDSHVIVGHLKEFHGIKKPLLVTVCDEFTMTQAGEYNRKNIADVFACDHILFRCNSQEFLAHTLKDFEEKLNPLLWIEERLYLLPIRIAKKFGIKLVFFGENSDFEYGGAEELDIFHPASDDETSVIFMGAIYPYSTDYFYRYAKKYGFKDLKDFEEWPRTGSIERFAQIDSIAYIVHLWCKFPKFGFQRVSDMACRFVREGRLTREQAAQYISDYDHMLDETAKVDFCRTIGITETYFNEVVDRHTNRQLVAKDVNGTYKRLDTL